MCRGRRSNVCVWSWENKNLSMRNLHIEDISMWLSLNLLKAKLLKASRLFSHTGFDFGSTVVCHLVSLFVHLSVYNKMCQNKFRLFAVVFQSSWKIILKMFRGLSTFNLAKQVMQLRNLYIMIFITHKTCKKKLLHSFRCDRQHQLRVEFWSESIASKESDTMSRLLHVVRSCSVSLSASKLTISQPPIITQPWTLYPLI